MNFLDAAYQILKQAGKPLHYIDIASQALKTGLVDTQGQTPEATMGARLYMEARQPRSRFRKLGKGIFALSETPPSHIAQQIEALNQRVRVELHGRLMSMPPDRFEALIGELLVALGFDESTVEVTPYGGDGGIDVRGTLRAGGVLNTDVAVQVKRWKKNVQAPTVQSVRGSLTTHQQGMVITTSDFSKGAQEEAVAPNKVPISLVNGEKLVDLLIEHEIGVTHQQHTLLSLDKEWWADLVGEAVDVPPPPEPTSPVSSMVSFPLPVQRMVGGKTHKAQLLDAKGRIYYAGTEYNSPSGAGQVASGWKSCNGWAFWQYQHPETGEWRLIGELRNK